MSNPAGGESATLLFEQEGAVARLTLNRPAAANAIDMALARELMLAAIRCDEDDSIRCVLITATGRFFCAGGDIRGFVAAGASIASLLKEMTAYYHMAVARFMRMNKPLVVAVNGTAAGAGFSLSLTGDLVIAGKAAQFTSAYTALGVSSDGGLSWLLPRLVGMRQAQELIFTNRMLSAEDALAMKLITRISDDASLGTDAMRAAQELASGPTRAYGTFRRLLLRSGESALESHLEEESRALAENASSPHGREGISAFIAKRKPDFGR
ncbi:MAG TPA: enoyl-CoA hydratase/isomerase family protein, partial [Steroidobacteraceae bacterium]|jgi:2-(1,2-epoxy-1,2-dihydrophenyl)acetyl-CoA isomerase|nr:enoyl-CoA hydratase/isomerase family protein [Steroidobacteraceae bacterium]